MAYKKYKIALGFRVLVLFLSLLGLAISVGELDFKKELSLNTILVFVFLISAIYTLRALYVFILRHFNQIDDFFESVKYRDFSRWFNEKTGPEDIKALHHGFNNINRTIQDINKEKEAQHLYLEKILELVKTGIIAYNIETGKVLWVNDAFKKQLDIPSLRNISFIENRKPKLFNTLFTENHDLNDTISITVGNEKTQLLINYSVFALEKETFKLIVIQNIDDTVNRTESEAWKKLLSVMTHEIMNSIAPISSLAETLQSQIQNTKEDQKLSLQDINDLEVGIESIKKRSEGLLKFAKTYRSLNKITTLNSSEVSVSELFENIKTLMQPSLNHKNISLQFDVENPLFKIEMDAHLIEQVLINLILNAVEACKENPEPEIALKALKTSEGQSVIKVIDNGKGIPQEVIDNVFIPFFTTKKTGSGIGLSLSKQIMLLHNGKIIIQSIENKGTSISLFF